MVFQCISSFRLRKLTNLTSNRRSRNARPRARGFIHLAVDQRRLGARRLVLLDDLKAHGSFEPLETPSKQLLEPEFDEMREDLKFKCN